MKQLLKFIYGYCRKKYYRTLSVLSPELNTKVIFKKVHGRELNLEDPQTFSEKLLFLKLKRYIKDPLVKQCADKYTVREYIAQQGCKDILIPLVAVYDDAKQIEWDELPNSFVIKWNFGCGFNIICPNKEKIITADVVKKLNKWKKDKSYLDNSEMQYHGRNKKILIEEYLKPRNGEMPADYKVYCFNGEPKAILFIDNRGTDKITAAFYDIDWNFISETGKGNYSKYKETVPAPVCLKEMIEVSKKLSSAFEFVRMDYYVVNDKLYFGEMTFTPAGSIHPSECIINGKTMGELLKIDNNAGKYK